MDATRILLEQAELLQAQGRAADATRKVKQALQQEPDNPRAHTLLARCYYDQQQYAEGIESLQEAIRLAPMESFNFYLLGFGYYRLDQNKTALGYIDNAIRLYPYQAEYFGIYSFILLDERQFEPALQKANEGLELDAENVTCLNARARALNKLRRTDMAIETMKDALAKDPDNEFTHNTIGWNYIETGQHKEAAHHFREALRINPVYPNAQAGLKEALKSRIPPYRWLLQYSFWINNKGKSARVAAPLALFFLFRLILYFLGTNKTTEGFAWIFGGIYLLFIFGSWTMNSLANFFLLFHPDGKYALTNTEKWAAITVVTSMLTGITLFVLAAGLPQNSLAATGNFPYLYVAGLICLSLCLPLGQIEFPIRIKKIPKSRIFSLLLIALGVICLISIGVAPALAGTLFPVYAIGFIIYNWSGVFR